MSTRIRVLVVDDSAFARKVIRQILSADPEIDVIDVARDGLDALEKIAQHAPDVITLDLVMPEVDGVGVLQVLASRANSPRAIIVSMTDMQAAAGVEALRVGAFDVVHKPTALATDRLYELGEELIRKVKAAGRAGQTAAPRRAVLQGSAARGSVAVVVIGASTGGPHAIAGLLRALPADFAAPIAIALHMPPGYTAAYAARIDGECALKVVEASDGDSLEAGMAAIGPGGMHLKLESTRTGARTRVHVAPQDASYRPSVDVLFASAAEGWGRAALAVVLTGMGNDGLEGARALREKGARVLVQSAESCVVYGMPRAVAEANLATGEAPLDDMPETLVRHVGRR